MAADPSLYWDFNSNAPPQGKIFLDNGSYFGLNANGQPQKLYMATDMSGGDLTYTGYTFDPRSGIEAHGGSGPKTFWDKSVMPVLPAAMAMFAGGAAAAGEGAAGAGAEAGAAGEGAGAAGGSTVLSEGAGNTAISDIPAMSGPGAAEGTGLPAVSGQTSVDVAAGSEAGGGAATLPGGASTIKGVKDALSIAAPLASLGVSAKALDASKKLGDQSGLNAPAVFPPNTMPVFGNTENLGAQRRALTEQLVRRGRASTVLTGDSAQSERLGSA